MKKFFLFAAAAIAAMTVNAKVVNFAGIIDKTDAETAKASFEAAYNLSNLTVAGAPNSSGSAYCAEIIQTNGTEAWDVTTMVLKSDDQVYFTFKDANANKKVAKAWADYIQPNGKAMCAVITGVKSGDKVNITLKETPSKQPVIEGASAGEPQVGEGSVVFELTATADEIRIYSKSEDNSEVKWKLISVELPDGDSSEGINNTNAAVKVEKFYRDGQLVIRKNGVEYNVLGAEIK